eukprot:365990-Chlamydomonas_euryale.AAC.36
MPWQRSSLPLAIASCFVGGMHRDCRLRCAHCGKLSRRARLRASHATWPTRHRCARRGPGPEFAVWCMLVLWEVGQRLKQVDVRVGEVRRRGLEGRDDSQRLSCARSTTCIGDVRWGGNGPSVTVQWLLPLCSPWPARAFPPTHGCCPSANLWLLRLPNVLPVAVALPPCPVRRASPTSNL